MALTKAIQLDNIASKLESTDVFLFTNYSKCLPKRRTGDEVGKD